MAFACLNLLMLGSEATFAATPITLFERHIGNTNYAATGGSFRTAANTVNACTVGTQSSGTLSGIPAGATIRAVYLYWVASGGTVDSTVTLNGSSINAQRTDTAVFAFNGTNYNFYTGFAEISASNIVTTNGTYTLSGLSIASGSPYCGVQVVTGGWSLYVVYDHPSEPLHAVNIFDGFQFFRGSAINLTASGFRIPADFISGRFTFSHYEGDPQNSTSLNGFSESLSLNGTLLDDGLVPPGSDPATQPYDGTINGQGVINSHGVDIDTYNVTPYLATGDETATVTMSAGGDLVLSTGMIIAVNTEPVVDLSIAQSHTGILASGSTLTLNVDVGNAGPEIEPNVVTVTETLPAGLNYVSATGSGWSCAPSGQDVVCTHPGPIAAGAALPTLGIEIDVDPGTSGDFTTTATVTSASLDTAPGNNQVTDIVTVVASDLSTSTKSVVDPNGGDAEPGDTLRYTITLAESGNVAATGISVTDDLPAFIDSFSVVSIPAGATDNSVPGGGSNGTGFIDIGSIDVPAGATAEIVFDVVIAVNATPGTIIANTATVTNPNGSGATPAAPDVVVSQSSIPASGTKTLYLYDLATGDPNGFSNGPAPYLSRTPPPGPQGNVTVDKNQPPRVWRLTPALQAPLTIEAGFVPVTLNLSKGGATGGSPTRRLEARLADGSGPIGAPVLQVFSAPPSANPATIVFNIPLAADRTVAAGETISLTLTNVTNGGGSRRIRVFPSSGGVASRVDFDALTVINVDQVDALDAPYPGGTALTNAAPGDTISLRAIVSDPFGSFDIASASIDIVDELGASRVSGAAMTRVADSNAATATYEYLYTIPPDAGNGDWSYRITAVEGTEAVVTHSANGSFVVQVPEPLLVVSKVVATDSDPINGTSGPFNIPGAVARYSVTVRNTGDGSPDPDSLTIADVVPDDTALIVNPASGDVVTFIDGPVASGVTLSLPAGIAYSSATGGGPPFDYTPSPGADGTDPAVTGFELTFSGQMNPASGTGEPSFTIEFSVRLAAL